MVVETIPETKPRSRSGGVTAGRRRAHSSRRRDHRSGFDSLAWWMAIVLIAAAVVVGLVLRLWLIFHSPLTSDEAVVGLVAQGMLHGHFTTFFWGQQTGYGRARRPRPLLPGAGSTRMGRDADDRSPVRHCRRPHWRVCTPTGAATRARPARRRARLGGTRSRSPGSVRTWGFRGSRSSAAWWCC